VQEELNVTQKRIWPALTVLSLVAIGGAVLCSDEQVEHARRSIEGWLGSSNTAQACETCKQGGATSVPKLFDLADECPFLVPGAEEDDAVPPLADPNVVLATADQPLPCGTHPAAGESPFSTTEVTAGEPGLHAAQVNEVTQAVATAPIEADSSPSDDAAAAEASNVLPTAGEGRYGGRYVTPVSHKAPTVVAAQPLAKDESPTTDAAETAGPQSTVPVKATLDEDGSIARPLPPLAPGVAPPGEPASPQFSIPIPTVMPGPFDTAPSVAPPNEENDRYRGSLVTRASAAPGAEAGRTIYPVSAPLLPNASKPSAMGLKWTLPDSLTLGQESTCLLQVCNGAETAVQNVTVSVQLSAGVRVQDAAPRPTSMQGSTLFWEMGDMAAGANPTIQIHVIPEAQGEFVPTARVTCTRSFVAKAPIVAPRLAMTIEGPQDAVVGQPTPFHVRVSNQGSSTAAGISLELELAEGLEGAAGFKSSYTIGTLAPGESRQVQVMVTGRNQGSYEIAGRTVLGDTRNSIASHTVKMVRPSLAVAMEGPKLRFVDRKAEYTINVKNPGPGVIENVQLQEAIPAGFRFVEASSGGSFDQQARRVAWFVGRLEPNQSANVALHLVAIEAGEHHLVAEAKADFGVAGGAEATTTVRGAPRVVIDVIEDDDPIEVAGETMYRVKLTNTGSIAALGVQFAGEVPREMEVLKVNGPVEGIIKGQQVVFPAIESLAPGETATYEVHVKCHKAGQVQFRAFFRSQDNPTPVLEEETTRIYAE
jgi:uncharacterized repeat protein (TIGR01451 family)